MTPTELPPPTALASSNPHGPVGRPRADALIVYAGRGLRDMGRGLIAVVLAIYLAEIGFSIPQIGLVLGVSLVGGFVLSLAVMFTANWISRRVWFIAIATITGLAVGRRCLRARCVELCDHQPRWSGCPGRLHTPRREQSALTEVAATRNRTRAFSNLSVSSAAGRAVGGALVGIATFLIGVRGWELIDAYKVLFAIYMGINLVNAAIYLGLSSAVETKATVGKLLVNPFKVPSRKPILRISGLFGIDSFAGGMIFDSFFALWMVQKYGLNEGTVAAILIATQGLNLVSIWLAPSVAKRIGLLNTFVWTQVAANVCLIAFAFSPTAIVAAGIWMLRGVFDEMDVPTRQAYMMALVPPEERTVMAASANLGRGLGRMPSSSVTGLLWAGSYTVAPWLLGGGLKLLYDFAIYFSFRNVRLPEDTGLE